jgi:thioredoxin 1
MMFFHASWCGPCKKVQPTIDAIKKDGYKVYEIDVDIQKNKSLVANYSVYSLPTVVITDIDGKELYRHEGSIDKETIESELKSCGDKSFEDTRFFGRFRERFKNRGSDGREERQNHRDLPKADWKKYPQLVIIENQSSGQTTSIVSGTIVDRNEAMGVEIVITCAHGYGDGCSEEITMYDGRKCDSRILAVNRELDTMVLMIPDAKIPPLQIKTEPSKVGDTISMLGFADGSILVRVEGTIQEFSADENMLSTTCDVWHGCSGGPVVDSSGRLIATVTGGVTDGGYTLHNLIGPYLYHTLPQM